MATSSVKDSEGFAAYPRHTRARVTGITGGRFTILHWRTKATSVRRRCRSIQAATISFSSSAACSLDSLLAARKTARKPSVLSITVPLPNRCRHHRRLLRQPSKRLTSKASRGFFNGGVAGSSRERLDPFCAECATAQDASQSAKHRRFSRVVESRRHSGGRDLGRHSVGFLERGRRSVCSGDG